MMRLLICLLFLWCVPTAAQTDTSQRTFYWPNGKIKSQGRQSEYGQIGAWSHYDSLGQLKRLEWYSFDEREADSEWFDGVTHLDSARYFDPGENLEATEINVRHRYYCRHSDHSWKTRKQWQHFSEVREYYPNGQLRRKLTFVETTCGHQDYSPDTLETKWYPSGQIEEVALNNGKWYRYYTNGTLKAFRSHYHPHPRDGDFLEMDSTGKVMLDRTYDKGKVIAVRDSSFHEVNQQRRVFSASAEGIAVMSLFPFHHVTGGDKQPLRYYSNGLPVWRQDAIIPDSIIDSVAYTWAGVLLAAPHSSGFERDSMLKFSREFHPSENVWYYTLTYAVYNYDAWLNSCRNGNLITGNPAADSFLRAVQYRMWSYTTCNAEKTRQATVVITTASPINFIAFHKALHGSDVPVTIYCGRTAMPQPAYRFQLMRSCGHSRTADCSSRNYADALITHRSPYGGHDGLSFNVNSDQTIDFLQRDFTVYGLGIHTWTDW